MWSELKYRFSLFFLFFTAFPLFSATLLIEGKFQNKNILVHNSLSKSGVGFCAKEIKVNGKITSDEINSSAFEIDLKALNLKFGEKVVIEIVHDPECRPKVLNPEDLFPKPTFEMLAFGMQANGILKWSTKNENGSLPFLIEQFRWNKWVPVGKVEGVGTPQTHEYSFQVTLHSGENKFRIRQKGYNSTVKVSSELSFIADVKTPTYVLNKEKVAFDSETAFEVYDEYGINLVKGFGKTIDIQGLKPGEYYLCYDNTTVSINK